MSAYEVRRIDDLEQIPIAGADINWRPIRRPLGIRAFGINAYTADEGKHVVEEHSETQLEHEEVYVVLTGRARFSLGDDEVEVAAGRLRLRARPADEAGRSGAGGRHDGARGGRQARRGLRAVGVGVVVRGSTAS